MATSNNQTSTSDATGQSEFELRRTALVGQIGDSLEQVLSQINALNRSLEGIIEIGNEFASVEALWSQFESVMGKDGGDQHSNQHETENEGGDAHAGEANG